MRDNGPRHSLRLRRSRFYLLLFFFLSLPFLCSLLAIQCWLLWEENGRLRASVERFEMDYQLAESRAERLENLEELLKEENISARELLVRQLAHNGKPPLAEESEQTGGDEAAFAEGPGHEEFAQLDTGRVKIDNVQARAMRGNNLRIGMDLRNPENESLLAGDIAATLVTAEGEKKQLTFTPEDAGNFRINRFKRAVITAHAPRDANLVNASVILEVRDISGAMIYQNIFAVQR